MTSAITPLMEVKTFAYEWAIENFSTSCLPLPYDKYPSTSSPYFPPKVGIIQCHIVAYTRGKSSATSSFVCLRVTPNCKDPIIFSTRFLILNDKKEKIPITDIKTICGTSIEFKISRDMIFAKKNRFLINDELTIICELSFAVENVEKCLPPNAIKIPQSKLCEDFKKLFENKKYSDLKIVVKGQEFKVHKALLTARSEVFAAMFSHEMDEQKSNQVNITDIEPEVIQAMLQYIYTDKVQKLNTLVYDLFFAADKYALQHLKKICEKFLISQISVETAAHTLLLADRHHGNKLKKYSFEFIINNVKDVVQTQGWKDVTKECPRLITEAFCAIAVGPEGN